MKFMTEVEKQESQKTVVAFITGLLIGGLLVWIFSSTPEEKVEVKDASTNTEQVGKSDTNQNTGIKADETKTQPAETQKIEIGDGSIKVLEQNAGASVILGAITLPTKSGWVVVRDDINGVPGNVLGAARYNADEGLSPLQVELIRNTEVGKSYQIMFYTQEGNPGFALGEDKPIEGTTATFKAK